MLRYVLVALIVSSLPGSPANAQSPSFDCNKARFPDEFTICRSPQLAELDNLVAAGYAFLKSMRGRSFADEIGIPFWRLRQACQSDIYCIRQRQTEALRALQAAGAPILLPRWMRADGSLSGPPTGPGGGPSGRDFIVDGLALGGVVYPKSSVYQAYSCRPSEDYSGFTWCARHRERSGQFGTYTSWVTLLHSDANRVVFITEAITPAFFNPGDVDREIARISKGFGQAARILTPDDKPGPAHAILATWGDATLTPLDETTLDALRRGEEIHRGLLADFIGDARKSAREGLPVFSLGGGPGFLWGTNFDDTGRGSLRISAVDVSEVGTAAGGVTTQRVPTPPPSPAPAPSASQQEPHTAKSGTGFFVTGDGHIITNAHVVRDCSEIRVGIGQGNVMFARLVAKDTTNDLALLKVDANSSHLASLRFAVRLGENVEAFGYPLSEILATTGNFTTGNVTALAGVGDDSRYIQVSTPIQPGNSGGPLLDENGNLVGIVSSKLNVISTLKSAGDIPENVNFAIKASVAANFLQDNSVKFQIGEATQAMKAADLADQAKALSVYVECQ